MAFPLAAQDRSMSVPLRLTISGCPIWASTFIPKRDTKAKATITRPSLLPFFNLISRSFHVCHLPISLSPDAVDFDLHHPRGFYGLK